MHSIWVGKGAKIITIALSVHKLAFNISNIIYGYLL